MSLPSQMSGHQVLWRARDDAPWAHDLVRVLQVMASTDTIVVIHVPAPIRPYCDTDGDHPASLLRAPRYHRGAERHSWSAVRSRIDARSLVPIDLPLRAIMTMSESDVARRWPDHTLPATADLQTQIARCPALRRAAQRWIWVHPLLGIADDCCYDPQILGPRIRSRSNECAITPAQLRSTMNQCLAWGGGQAALRPYYDLCGAPGQTRAQRSIKIGRPNAVAIRDANAMRADGIELRPNQLPSAGRILTPIDITSLQDAWDYYVIPGRSVEEAYLAACATYWTTGEMRQDDGYLVPTLLPAHDRPSLAQFRYWGSRRGSPENTAWYRHLGRNKYDRTRRPLERRERDGIQSVGQMAVEDASPNDVYLVSEFCRLRVIGTAHRILWSDVLTQIIPGFYCGLSAPSQRTAMLALMSGILPMAPFAARFGYAINESDWPRIWPQRLRSDNGEMRTEMLLEELPDEYLTVEHIPVSRPDLNRAEPHHHHLHAILDHRLPGTTHGRRRERGEDDARIPASLTFKEYVLALLRAVKFSNCDEEVPQLLTAEMLQDRVEPYRIAIYEWALNRGYVVQSQPDLTRLRSLILPRVKGRIKANGVFVLRCDRGARTEFMPFVRYHSQYLIDSGLLAAARSIGSIDIDLRIDPGDLDTAYFSDEHGFHSLTNVDYDDVLRSDSTVWSLLDLGDDEVERSLARRSDADQAKLAYVCGRTAIADAANAQKRKDVKAAGRPTKKDLAADVSAHRAAERLSVEALTGEPPISFTPPVVGPSAADVAESAGDDGYDSYL